MKKFLKNLILPIAVVMMFGGFANVAFAVTSFVTFTPDPLFVQGNFLPLDETFGTVTVTNNSGSEQTILTEAINVLDNGNFGSLLNLNISGGTPFNNSLSNFFSTAGEVSLGTIASGESKTFTYTVSFINSNDNTYQGKTLGFDICVGFQGGTTHCGDTVVGGEGDTGGGGGGTGNPPPGGTISGSGGRSGGTTRLLISGEQATSINPVDGSAVITWNTNLLATSQVIYGLAPGPYALNLGILPNFGYPLGTAETATKVTNHSVTLTGLTPGTYLYRVVSRASPPTVSVEHTFTMPTKGAGNVVIAQAGPTTDENTGGGNTGDTTNIGSAPVKQEPFLLNSETAEDNSNLLAFALGGLNFGLHALLCVGVALIIFLILLALIWLILKDENNKPYQYQTLPSILLVVFGLVVSAILWLIPYTCPIIPFWVVVAIYVIWQLFTRSSTNNQ